jgi:putative membrane protein
VTPLPAFAAHADVWLVLGGVVAIYLYAVIRIGPLMVESGAKPATSRQIGSFLAGVGVLWLVSDWPVHDIAEQSLYSVHMAQHMAIILIAPPLLLAGTPRWLAELLLPSRIRPAVRAICAPVPALLISIAVLVFTHWPAVVTMAVTSGPAHLALHSLALVTALVMWMPILSPTPVVPRARPLVQIGYLFAQSVIPTIPASFLTFGHEPLYRVYGDSAEIWGISAVTDQTLAGLLMKIGGGLILWGWIAVIWFRWYREEQTWESLERELRRPSVS